MKKIFFISLFFMIAFNCLYSQEVTIKGKALDTEKKTPLTSATVQLFDNTNTSKYSGKTDNKGDFILTNIAPGNYKLKITYIGYAPFEKEIRVTRRPEQDLGNLALEPGGVTTGEVEITAQAPLGEQKGDTTEFRAESFKTMPDASAEDLVKKMPGVQVEADGTVKAQGEEVKKVLVDGKPFFGEDPTVALRNLPADLIDRIQVFDRMSDQAAFTGFDDGQGVKALNILTKRNRRSGQFGKLNGGYGSEDRYSVGLNLNVFENTSRITLLGMSNNVSQQNFAFQDILGSFGGNDQRAQFARTMTSRGVTTPFRPGTRGPGSGGGMGLGNFMVGQLDGISSTHALGMNFSDQWFEKIELSGSYFFNYTQNENLQEINRDYIIGSENAQFFDQTGETLTKNINHRFNMQVDYFIDSSHSIMLKPSFTVQANSNNSDLFGINRSAGLTPMNTSNNEFTSNYTGVNFANDLLYRYKFDTPGRTISLNLNTSLNNRYGESLQFTKNEIYQSEAIISDSLHQLAKAPVSGYGLSTNLNYTEPIAKDQQLQLTYRADYNFNNSDRKAYTLDEIATDFTMLDTLLSNKYDNYYFTQRGGVGYRLRDDKFNLTAQLDYQISELDGEQVFPYASDLNYRFSKLLPSMRFSYKSSPRDELRIHYRSSTNNPSIQQLQNVVDISNPLALSTGNPELKEQNSHFIMTRYSTFSPDFSNIFLIFGMVNFRTDYIANSTILARKDTLIENRIVLPAGGQFTKPVNMDGFINASTFINYGFPISLIRSNINLNTGLLYSRTPSLINGNENYSNSYNTFLQFVLSSNVSAELDFTVSSRANFAITKNTLRSDMDNNYNSYTNTANFNWIFWEGFFFSFELRNQYYTGLVQQDNNNFTLLNLSVGKKFLTNNAGEIKLTVFDALKQNKNIATNITDYYVEYSSNRVLQQYVMLTFTYNLRNFGG